MVSRKSASKSSSSRSSGSKSSSSRSSKASSSSSSKKANSKKSDVTISPELFISDRYQKKYEKKVRTGLKGLFKNTAKKVQETLDNLKDKKATKKRRSCFSKLCRRKSKDSSSSSVKISDDTMNEINKIPKRAVRMNVTRSAKRNRRAKRRAEKSLKRFASNLNK